MLPIGCCLFSHFFFHLLSGVKKSTEGHSSEGSTMDILCVVEKLSSIVIQSLKDIQHTSKQSWEIYV